MRGLWASIKSLSAIMFGAVGVAGVPDAVKTWALWLDAIAPYLNQDSARWAFLVLAAVIFSTFWPWRSWWDSWFHETYSIPELRELKDVLGTPGSQDVRNAEFYNRLSFLTKEKYPQLPDELVSQIRDIKGKWFGNRFVIDCPVVEYDGTITNMFESFDLVIGCPPNSLATVKYDVQRHDAIPPKLAIGKSGFAGKPTLSGQGTIEVQVDGDCKIGVQFEQDFQGTISLKLSILGWELE